MTELPETKISVRIVSHQHTHAGITYPRGTMLEVTPRVFEKMQKQGAAVAVEIAIPGSANIDMEAARANYQNELQHNLTEGRPSPPSSRRRRFSRG